VAKRNYYKERIAKGLCGKCGESNSGGGSLCPSCKQKAAAKAAARREANKASGLCSQCGKVKSEPGKLRCSTCLKRHAAYRKEQSLAWKEQGLCQHCGATAKDDCTLCQTCIDKLSKTASKHYHRRKAAGTCPYCNNPVSPGRAACEKHLQKQREYRQARSTTSENRDA